MPDKKMLSESPTEATRKINIASELKKFSTTETKFKVNGGDDFALGRNDLRALYEVSRAVNSSLILDEILSIVMKKAIELLHAERGFLMLLDSDGNLQFKTARKINKIEMDESDLQVPSSIARSVVETGKSLYTSDALKDGRFSDKKSVLEMKIRSAICVPLKIKDQTIGVVYLDNSAKANIFLKSDLHLFELFADQASLAIHNAQLYSELFDLQRFQEAILDKTPVGIIVLTEDGEIISYNNVSFALLKKASLLPNDGGYDLLGKNFLEILPSSERNFWRENIAKSAEITVEIPPRRQKTGSGDIVFRYRFSPFHHVSDDLNGRIVVIEDITEKVILEKSLILSEKMAAKGELAAAIGHELNNYLTAISTNAQLLPRIIEKGQMEKVPAKVDTMLASIDKMKRFTSGLMDFSVLETRKIRHDISTVLDDVVFFVKPLQKFKVIDITLDIDRDIPNVMIDIGQIHQVILNLLMNAADGIADNGIADGAIKITTGCEEGCATVVISDNGPGIPADILPNLFEPHITSKTSGHGLGLSISLRIIERHGGQLTALNNPAGGASFVIKLPLGKDDE